MRLFADDTALYLTIESEDDGSALQNDLDLLSKWETRWDMEFNPSKCQVVHVTGSKIPIKKDYVLHGQVLESVSCAKYLGVDISSSLSWNSHINHIVSSANRTQNFVLRNIKTKIPKVRETAYNSLVRPQLEYASAVWDPNHKKRISQIEQVQRRAARWTVGNFYQRASVTQIVQNLGWRTLEQRRADARLCLFYKVVHGLVAVPLPDYIQYSNRVSRYCHSMTFRQVTTSTDYYKYSFFPLAIVQWNALPCLLHARRALRSLRPQSASCNILALRSLLVCFYLILAILNYLNLSPVFTLHLNAFNSSFTFPYSV